MDSCSCCYTQRKSSGPEGHCDGNFLVLLLRNLFSSAALPTGTLVPPFERRESTRKRMRAFARTAAMPNDRVALQYRANDDGQVQGRRGKFCVCDVHAFSAYPGIINVHV